MKPLNSQLRQSSDRLVVSGDVTLETVPELEQALDSLQPGIREVDLSGVRRVDSAALAWLAALCALGRDGPPVFLQAPENLRTLAQLYELDFLGFEPENREKAPS